jgi:AraC-like DNA-binding protein
MPAPEDARLTHVDYRRGMSTPAVHAPVLPARSGDMVADIVADVVAAIRKGTAVYCRARLHAPWGLSIPAGTTSVHVITAGTCWLVSGGCTPIQLTRGDVVLVPSGASHSIADHPDRPTRPLMDLTGVPLGEAPPRELVLDGDGPATGLLCGGYLLAPSPRHPLTAILPPILHVDAGQARGTGLAGAVDLLSAEVDRADPGAPAVVASLLDLLFVYVLRTWLAEQRQDCGGWVQALYDPTVGGALVLIHAEPGRPWSVASLARAVGVPRATFSRRFTALTGQAPMAYVTAWRMTTAARLLREQRVPLREVARRVGYDSEFAFARAFKRTVGHPPGRYRHAVDASSQPSAS